MKSPSRLLKHKGVATILAIVIFIFLWELAVRVGFIRATFFPPPSSVFDTFETVRMKILAGLWVTFSHFGLSYIIGAITGTLVGLLVGYFPPLERTAGSVLGAIFPIPRLTYLPLFILWFGYSDFTIVTLCALSMFFVVYMNTFSGVKKIDPGYIEVFQNLGGRPHGVFWRVVLPVTLPFILIGMRYGIGRVFSNVIVTEMFINQGGLGGLFWSAVNLFQPERIVLLQIVVIVISLVIFWSFDRVERRSFPWLTRRDNAAES